MFVDYEGLLQVLDLRIQAKQSVTDVVVLHSGAIAIKDRPLALSHVHQVQSP